MHATLFSTNCCKQEKTRHRSQHINFVLRKLWRRLEVSLNPALAHEGTLLKTNVKKGRGVGGYHHSVVLDRQMAAVWQRVDITTMKDKSVDIKDGGDG